MVNVFTQTITRKITLPGLIDAWKQTDQTGFVVILDLLQLKQGTLVVATRLHRFYIHNEYQTLALPVDALIESMVELKSGLAIGHANNVVLYDQNWNRYATLETPGKSLLVLRDGRLVTSGIVGGANKTVVWKGTQKLLELDKMAFIQLYGYVFSHWESEVPTIVEYSRNMLFCSISERSLLWNLFTNTRLKREGRFTMYISILGVPYGHYSQVLTNMVTGKQHHFIGDNFIASLWEGTFAEVEDGVIAWPSVEKIVVYDTVSKVSKDYKLRDDLKLRGYYFE